jgi:SAM-dependent methyltransferase
MGNDAYGLLAKYYDYLMADVPYRRWIEFIAAYAEKQGRPSSFRIVDAGCGTGTVALGLRRKGFWVAGLDQSPEMLALARSKAEELQLCMPLYQGNFIDMPLKADLVISTCDGINHLLSKKGLIKFFQRTHGCLSKNGSLLFDINTEYKYKRILGNKVFAWGIENMDMSWLNQFSYPFNFAEISMYIQRNKGCWSKASFSIQQRCHQVSSLVYYLEKTGFQLKGIWNNYSFKTITPRTQRLTLIAQKK